jgi:hypothetical protein
MGHEEEYPPVLSDLDYQTKNITSPARQGRVKYSILIMFLCGALGFTGNLLYTNKVNKDSNHQWCEILISIIQPEPGAPPPTTERGRRQVQIMTKLAREKGCI